MKKTIPVFVLILVSNVVFSQYFKIKEKEIIKIKNSILIVSLEEEDKETLKKLSKKKDELEQYKNQIAGRNNALQQAVKNYWHFTDSIIVLPKKEAEELAFNEDGYVALSLSKMYQYEEFSSGVSANGKPVGWSYEKSYMGTRPSQSPHTELVYNPATKYSNLANVISILRLKGDINSIDTYLPNVYPSYSDIIYGIKQLEYSLKFYDENRGASALNFLQEFKKNNIELKDKILLFDKDDIHKSLTEESIKEIYPYNFKIVSLDFIEKVIAEENDEYAYIQIVKMSQGSGNINAHIISNPANGMIYCFEYPKVTFTIKGSSFITYNERIKKNNVENYTKFVEY